MKEYFETFFPAGHNMRILLADDHRMNLELMAFCLKDHGFDNILMADNGEEALEQYQESNDEIILVVSDVQMPVMRGDELFWRLKQDRKDVRFLLCTGMANGLDTKSLFQAGLKGFLQKPFTANQFWLAVASALI